MARVLIVDDDWFTRQLHADFLSIEGIEVTTAEDSRQALDLLGGGDPHDLIVADIMMPGMDGVDLIRECKRRHSDVEVVVVTALNSVDTAVRALKAGAFDYLVKPVDAETLMFAVERGLKNRKILAENKELSRQLRLFHACQQVSTCLERDVFYRLVLDSFAEVVQFDMALYVDLSREQAAAPGTAALTLGDDDFREPTTPRDPGARRSDVRAGAGIPRSSGMVLTRGLVDAGLVELCLRGETSVVPPDVVVQAVQAAWARERPESAAAQPADEQGSPDPPQRILAVPVGRGDGLRAVVLLTRSRGGAPFSVVDTTQASFLARYVLFALINLDKYGDALTLAYRDELTDLWNVRYFAEVLRREVTRHQRTGQPFSVLFIDLDHFKLVNDGHGHLIGSRLLVEVARVVCRCVRDEDMVFRYGGDEFTLVLLNTDSTGGMVVAERVRAALERHSFLCREGLNVRLTASIGVATLPEHAATVSELIEMADRAMYQGKYTTRNAVYLASQDYPPLPPRAARTGA